MIHFRLKIKNAEAIHTDTHKGEIKIFSLLIDLMAWVAPSDSFYHLSNLVVSLISV